MLLQLLQALPSMLSLNPAAVGFAAAGSIAASTVSAAIRQGAS
jgi:hypothetical protein